MVRATLIETLTVSLKLTKTYRPNVDITSAAKTNLYC